MTLEAIIALCQDIEAGNEGQKIGRHLHEALNAATNQLWPTNASYPETFSGFLSALKDADPPEKGDTHERS
jgi:hypothetical protein